MIKFALKGLLGRKLRTALTAIAIVLGVAMVSGTYVLTDSIDQAFDAIFNDVRQGSDAVVTGRSAFDLTDGSGSEAPTLDESLLDRVRTLPEVAAGRGRRRQRVDRPDRQGRQGDRRQRAEHRLQHRQRQLALQPAEARRGRLAGAERDRDRRGHGEEGGLQRRRHDQRAGRGRRPAVPDLGARALRRHAVDDRRRHARRLRPADGATSLQQGRAARRDRRLFEPECLPGGAHRRDRGRAPADRPGPNRPGAGERGSVRDERVHHVPPGLPACVRRNRALRRQLRDRELARDHDRAADSRVRDDQDDRRLAKAGARLDHPRGARRRDPRVGTRALPRPRSRNRALQALRRSRVHAAEHGARLRDSDDRRRPERRHPRHAAREPSPGDPGDAGAADCRCPRRGDAARVALRAVPHGRRLGAHPPRFRFHPLRAVRPRPRDDEPAPLARARSAPGLRGRSHCSPSSSSARSPTPWAGRPRRSAVPQARLRGTTLAGTRSGPPRRPRR